MHHVTASGGSAVDLHPTGVVTELQVLAPVTRAVPAHRVLLNMVVPVGHTIAVLTRVIITGMNRLRSVHGPIVVSVSSPNFRSRFVFVTIFKVLVNGARMGPRFLEVHPLVCQERRGSRSV